MDVERVGHTDITGDLGSRVAHRLAERTVEVTIAVSSHRRVPRSRQEQVGNNDNYGSARAAHPGRSQGRPTTNTGSRPLSKTGLPTPSTPNAPVPDGRTVIRRPLPP